ncbi:putative acetyltransferase [Methanimicrococcus sp. At1]|uniref:Acetyltransferase n=1 Tax=Methanimicrococcus hacksteinii TaxID=3028293 RepID=A0ABU3VN72_9EURY|nr:sugar O-acetyltransferase [Methanimicrococcus sp. At1]MDV0444855.1 putative acetyltransferase [Methanimicrococcus sp. At1]
MMTEKEKAAAGLLYDSALKSFEKERHRAKKLYHKYNICKPTAFKKRNRIIKKLFGKTGKNFLIEQPFYCDYGYNIEIGSNFFTNMNCVMLDGAKIKFGNNVMIGPNVGFYGTGHPLNVEIRNKFIEYSYPITVGSNVWIGGGVSIMGGVTIGDNSVIGAGSVVTKDIPANSVAYGNPCRVARTIDQDEAKRNEKYFKKLTKEEFKKLKTEL